jgi:hypothetical protein
MPRHQPPSTFPFFESSNPSVETLTRRAALARALALPVYAVLPATLAGCSKGPHCEDTSGLSPDDAKLRTEIAAYVDVSTDPTKHCADCIQFVSAGKDACGTCKVVKGPINPVGSCKLFQKKP